MMKWARLGSSNEKSVMDRLKQIHDAFQLSIRSLISDG